MKITSITASSAAGVGRKEHLKSILSEKSGLAKTNFDSHMLLDTWVGEVPQINAVQLPGGFTDYDCRNNRLACLALEQDGFLGDAKRIVSKYGKNRIGVFIGTSTSGIQATELAYREMLLEGVSRLPDWYCYDTTHNNYSAASFVARICGVAGPCFTVSTACSSSAKVFANAVRAINSGMCDAAIVGGVDSLCLTTLYGFNSLQLLSAAPCKPCDKDRTGISIGEAAGFAIIERDSDRGVMNILGFGESSDAYHMSSPPPDGGGAKNAMKLALDMAGLSVSDLGYVNLHGTGTKVNDSAETNAICDLGIKHVPLSSSKAWTGHTLGAAGILEACICSIVIQEKVVPGTLNCECVDPEITVNVVTRNECVNDVENVMSNSFGFGGSNCSLIFGAFGG